MQTPQSERRAYLTGLSFAVIGTLLFSMKAIVIKLSYGYAIDSVSLLALRMLLAVPLYVVIGLLFARGLPALSPRQYAWIAALGLCGYYGASILDLEGLRYVSAGLERLILYVYPTLVLALGALLFRRRIHRRELLAMAVCYAGLSLVFAQDLELHRGAAVTGASLILASAAAYAVFVLGSGRLVPQVGSIRFTCYAMAAAGAGVAAHFAATRPSSLLAQPREIYALATVLAVLCTVVPSFLVSAGIGRIGAERAALAGMLGPAATLLLGNAVLGEPVTAAHLAGTGLVVGGTLLLGRR